jgi:hypothetical protein
LRQSVRLYTLAIAIFLVLQAYALSQVGPLPTWNGSFTYQGTQYTDRRLTVFLTYNVCDGICDITSHEWRCGFYGFHSDTVFGSTPEVVTWLFAEYSDISAIPYTDVDILSHEVGEWADDPYYSNATYCGEMEIGHPLEGPPPKDYTYGTYHLQDLVFLRWFGANIDTSVNNQWSFQNETLSVCTPP